MSAVPYLPDAMDAETAERLSLVATNLAHGEFEFEGGPWRFRLAPATSAPTWTDGLYWISAETGGAVFDAVLPTAALGLFYRHRFPHMSLEILPESLALAGLDIALRTLAQRLEAALGHPVRLVGAGTLARDARLAGPHGFRFSLSSGMASDGTDGWLGTGGAGVALLAALAAAVPAARQRLDPSLPVSLRVVVGEMRVTAAELMDVSVLDVLLPEHPVDPTEPRAWLHGGRRRVRGRLRDDAFVVESTWETPEMSESFLPDDESVAERPVDVREVEVRLSFDVGCKVLTLAELACLAPGQIVPLDRPLPRLVALRVGERLIGRGELVRIDERVGVRVLQMAQHDGAQPALAPVPSAAHDDDSAALP